MVNIDLITGFLGAGKTTFITKYCEYLKSKEISFAVIENEYGSRGIDSKILNAHGIDTDELFGGCICCTLKVGFHDMLLKLSESFDRVIVEPSGVYDISQFFSVMASPELMGKCGIGNIICIVDPHTLSDFDGTSLELLRNQVKSSGAIIFSMTENSEKEELEAYKLRLEALLSIDDLNVISYNDTDLLFNCSYQNNRVIKEDRHSDIFLSTLIKPEPCKPCEMHDRVSTLFDSELVGKIQRVKGIWNGYLVNAVAAHIEITPFEGDTGLNIIGTDIDRKEIKSILNGNRG